MLDDYVNEEVRTGRLRAEYDRLKAEIGAEDRDLEKRRIDPGAVRRRRRMLYMSELMYELGMFDGIPFLRERRMAEIEARRRGNTAKKSLK